MHSWHTRCLVALLALLSSGCAQFVADSLPPPAVDGAALDSPVASLSAFVACGYSAELRVATASGPGRACSDTMPGAGDIVRLANGASGKVELELGTWRLPLASAKNCDFEFRGCATSEKTWLNLEARLQVVDGKPVLEVTGEAITQHVLAACPASVTYTLAVPTGCATVGRWLVATAPARTFGSCDYSWQSGVLRVEGSASGMTLIWPGASAAFTALWDQDQCKGSTAQQYSVIDGYARTASIEWTISNDAMQGVISDRMEPASKDVQCDASFAFSAVRQGPGGGGLPAEIGTLCPSRPYVCGNGTCDVDLGEGCDVCPKDCPCAQNESCIAGLSPSCRIPCKVWDTSTETDCPAGMRCLSALTSDGVDKGTFCTPEGKAAMSEPCTTSADCRTGLFCFKQPAMSWDSRVCALPCPADPEKCPAGCRYASTTAKTDPKYMCPQACDRGSTGQCPPTSFCFDADYASNDGKPKASPTCVLVGSVSLGKLYENCTKSSKLFGKVVKPCGEGLSCYFPFPWMDESGVCSKQCGAKSPCPSGECVNGWCNPGPH